MIAEKIVRGLVFVFSWVAWDTLFKDLFYDWFAFEADRGLIELILGYTICFVVSYIVSFVLIGALKIKRNEETWGGTYQ